MQVYLGVNPIEETVTYYLGNIHRLTLSKPCTYNLDLTLRAGES